MTSRMCLLFYAIYVWCVLVTFSDGKGGDFKRIRRSPISWRGYTTRAPIIVDFPDLNVITSKVNDLNERVKGTQDIQERAKQAQEMLSHFGLFRPKVYSIPERINIYFKNLLYLNYPQGKNYQLFHFYNKREDVIPVSNISADNIIKCSSDYTCPSNTRSLCLKNNDIYCVARYFKSNPDECKIIVENTTYTIEKVARCMNTTIPYGDGIKQITLPCLTSIGIEITKDTPRLYDEPLISLSGRNTSINFALADDKTLCVPAFATTLPEDKKTPKVAPKDEKFVPTETPKTNTSSNQSDLAECIKRIGFQECLYGPNYKLYPHKVINFLDQKIN